MGLSMIDLVLPWKQHFVVGQCQIFWVHTTETWCNEPRKCRILIFSNNSLNTSTICVPQIYDTHIWQTIKCAYMHWHIICMCTNIHLYHLCAPNVLTFSYPPSVRLYVMSVLPDTSKLLHHCFSLFFVFYSRHRFS